MMPIQIWLPTVQGGIARLELRRDMPRMFRAWRGEDLMWTIPDWKGPRTWSHGSTRIGCVVGEFYECVDIMHVAITEPSWARELLPVQTSRSMDFWLLG